MVARFAYQWADQRQPIKDRPVCIILVTDIPDPRDVATSQNPTLLKRVIYLPITTKSPRPDQIGIAIPPLVAAQLRLRDDPSWIIASECNVQFWPNDLARARGKLSDWYHGFIPPNFFDRIRAIFEAELAKRKVKAPKIIYLPGRAPKR